MQCVVRNAVLSAVGVTILILAIIVGFVVYVYR